MKPPTGVEMTLARRKCCGYPVSKAFSTNAASNGLGRRVRTQPRSLLLDALSAAKGVWGRAGSSQVALPHLSKHCHSAAMPRGVRSGCSIAMAKHTDTFSFPSYRLFLSESLLLPLSLLSILRCGPSIRPDPARGLDWNPCHDDGFPAGQQMPKCTR